MRKQREEPPPPKSLMPQVPADLDALCTDLLRFDPRARPDGAQVLARLGVSDPSAGASRVPSISTSSRFVGRLREMTELHAALQQSQTGTPVSVFVYGESGIGKSSLVRHFLHEVENEPSHVLVLQGRCYERESVPFKAFDGVVDSLSRHLSRIDQIDAARLLPRDAPLIARVFPVLRQIPALAKAPEPRMQIPNALEVRTRAFAALRELLVRLAEHAPVVLFIDDFQWSDADSRVLLGELLSPPHSPALMLLATVRTDPVSGGSMALPMLTQANLGDVRGLHLAPLPPAEAKELCDSLLRDQAGSAARAQLIAEEAAGHPLFLQELVRHIAAGTAPDRLGARLDEALWARVLDLEPRARELVEVIAVAGAPIPTEVAVAAARVEPAEAARLLPLLRVAHLSRAARLRGREAVEPYHDRVREAVLANLSPEQQRAHHERLAGALEAAGAVMRHPQVLVRHLEAAGQPERAAEQAVRAAQRAMETLAFDQAAELYQTALRLGRYGDEELRKLRMGLGDALADAGRGVEAADVLLAASEGADAATRFACQRRAAEQLLGYGHLERGREILEGVLHEIGERLPATSGRALASLVWQRARLRLRGTGWTPCDASEVPARRLAEIDVCQTVAIGLGMIDSVRGAAFQSRGLYLALGAGERRRVARAVGFEAVYQATSGGRGLHRARKLVAETRRIADGEKDPYLLALADGCQGIVELYDGAFVEAARLLADAEARLRDETAGTALELANLRIFRLIALRFIGNFTELKRDYHTYVRDAVRRGDRFTETTMTRAFNCVFLVDGRPDLAEQMLDRRSWVPPDTGYHVQHWYEVLARAELAFYKGDGAAERERRRAEHESLERSFLARLQMIRSAATWMHARLALDSGDLKEAERRIARLRKERMSYVDVWVDLSHAAVQMARGDKRGAAETLARAASNSQAQGRRFYEVAARRRLGEALSDPRLVEAADARMRADGVRDPERLVCVVAPKLRTG
jgi:hypothetical protein